MMSEMVERVGQAIMRAGDLWRMQQSGTGPTLAAAMGAAAIAAMQEPTEGMVCEGDDAMDWDFSDAIGRYFVHYHQGDAAKSWRAMIDEALREEG